MKRQRVLGERCGTGDQDSSEWREASWTSAHRQDDCLKLPLDGGAVLEAFQWESRASLDNA